MKENNTPTLGQQVEDIVKSKAADLRKLLLADITDNDLIKQAFNISRSAQMELRAII